MTDTKPKKLFTLGHWTVKEGKEEAFIEEWGAFARWTARQHPAAGTGYLLQDARQSAAFISFGAWESADDVLAWRESTEFTQFAAKARTLCEVFQPGTFILVATSGTPDGDAR